MAVFVSPVVQGIMLGYGSPFVVAAAAGLVMWFSQLKTGYIRSVNFVAQSAFAAYMFHSHGGVRKFVFDTPLRHLYSQYDGIMCIIAFALWLIVVYLAAMCVDQIRKLLYNKLILPLFSDKGADMKPSLDIPREKY